MPRKVPHYELPFFDFDVHALNVWAAEQVGHSEPFEPEVLIVDRPTLAAVWTQDQPRIEIHSLFNVSWLPIEVMRHVLIHEHIHKLVPAREVDGVRMTHPPEFWEVERRLSPYAGAVWVWIYLEWGDLLKRDVIGECIHVNRQWKKFRSQKGSSVAELYRRAGQVPPPHQPTSWDEAVARWDRQATRDGLI